MATSSQEASTRTESTSESIEIGRQEANRQKTKFVVRRIPSFVKEDDIKQHLDEFIQSFDWFLFCSQPKVSNPTRRNKNNYNRFYINFTSFDAAVPFIEKFQKLTFQKKEAKPQSAEQTAKQSLFDQYNAKLRRMHSDYQQNKVLVEFAPNPSLPNVITTKDRRNNTIETDSDYLKFIEALKTQQTEVQHIREEAEDACIRKNVMLVNKYSTKNPEHKAGQKETKPNAKPVQIAPLAQHVAKRDRRKKLYSKKITRASLERSEKAKVKKIERRREIRRRKRIALAKAGKYGNKWGRAGEEDGGHEYDIKGKRERYYEKTGRYDYYGARRKRGGRGRGRGRRGRGRGARNAYRGRGDPHYSGYSRRKGHQTWQKAGK
eukprot:36202_1